jgi:hypothetical protein
LWNEGNEEPRFFSVLYLRRKLVTPTEEGQGNHKTSTIGIPTEGRNLVFERDAPKRESPFSAKYKIPPFGRDVNG